MKNNIEFIQTVKELLNDEMVLPKLTNKYIPEWYKSTPLTTHSTEIAGKRTIKACPAISDLFSLGYVLPAWSDIAIHYADGIPSAKIGHNIDKMETHTNDQFLDYVEHNFLGKEGKFVFKLNNPWNIKTSKGWSVLQLPLLYNFDKNFSIMGGIIDTDIYHQINLQIMYFGKEEVVIAKGTPLVQFIPFKREKNNLIIRPADDKDLKAFKIIELAIKTKFSRGYLQLRKNKHND